VSYRIDADNRRLYRQLGNAPAQPMVERIAADQSSFRFFADSDHEITAQELDLAAARARVRYIEIELTLTPPLPQPQHSAVAPTRHRAVVALRNRIGNR
jgi:hypothetical protein